MNKELFNHFCIFSKAHLKSGDIDPVYPVLREVQRFRDNTREEALWHTLLYFTWYHLGSAEAALKKYPSMGIIPDLPAWPTGIERRGFRGEVGAAKAAAMLNHIAGMGMPLADWIGSCCRGGGTEGWDRMFHAIADLPQCGTWAAYKWCDLMKNVHGYDIEAPDIGYGGGGETAGPIPGMVKLTGKDWKECATNAQAQFELLDACRLAGVPFTGLDQLETALCDFNSLTNGHYYLGHDIDKQMTDIMNLPNEYWAAREKVFPHCCLGELNGWNGVRNHLKMVYKTVNVVYMPKELR